MTCRDCQEVITDYVHGELDAAADATVFEHIQSCAACRAELAAQTALTEQLRAAYATELEMPTSILARVRQAVRREPAGWFDSVRAVLRPVVLAPTAAAIVLVAGVVSYVHNTNAHGTTAEQLSAGYFVRQHVVHTMNSGDRSWNTYLLTSNPDDANAQTP